MPVRSVVDTSRGSVTLRSAIEGGRRRGRRTQAGSFAGGLFQVQQLRGGRITGLTDLVLKGGSFANCGRTRRAAVGVSRKRSRRPVRRLRGDAKGRFRTRGRYGAVTVRGTIWTTTDRCDGTLVTVKRGIVAVRDFRRRKTIILRTGKRYLARP